MLTIEICASYSRLGIRGQLSATFSIVLQALLTIISHKIHGISYTFMIHFLSFCGFQIAHMYIKYATYCAFLVQLQCLCIASLYIKYATYRAFLVQFQCLCIASILTIKSIICSIEHKINVAYQFMQKQSTVPLSRYIGTSRVPRHN